MKTAVVCSGGLDSVTLAYQVGKERELDRLISFDYGQKHKKELEYAARAAADIGVAHNIVDISGIARFFKRSALTGDLEVPEGSYSEDNMQVTVVPNRNAIMLSIAYGIVADEAISAVAVAVHGGDHFIYPDCRPEFIDAFRRMQDVALEGIADIELLAPYVHMDKADIVRLGAALEVPFHLTWSCYKGGDFHCGRCGTCIERQEAFNVAGIDDPTVYQDAA
jgi:7-cyano-7-deazaguanine synthase